MSYNIEQEDLPNLRPVPEYDGYHAGEDGEVYSHRRGGWHRLKPDQSSDPKHPYLRVSLTRDRKQHRLSVHRVIAMAWIGPPTPEKPDTRHLDGNPKNNVPSNLLWGTKVENWQDARDHGTAPVGDRSGARTKPEKLSKGEDHHNSVFTESLVAEIKAELIMNNRVGLGSELARRHGVTPTAISCIKRGLSWAWVAPALPEGWEPPTATRLSAAQHAANVLRETGNPSLSYHDANLIHAVADRAGIPRNGPDTSVVVIRAIERTYRGELVKGYCLEGRLTRRYWLPECIPDHFRDTRSNQPEETNHV